ncbi:hypothetical protein A11A3_08620 [Alcanivorax hongdengensis A-11-3]|uniref:Uncharacterized protein n=1 Tax=Alcanivorax hongdengensis A-11-3 TaxID=1177179 RepID=L0WC05_9GAMM|nr:hypothetical protein [Alcanivorax hongdengensis]EKF74471.1 hypothetical protein A11A3_08620 [Alcanivorax hongdengensis A-11-3]
MAPARGAQQQKKGTDKADQEALATLAGLVQVMIEIALAADNEQQADAGGQVGFQKPAAQPQSGQENNPLLPWYLTRARPTIKLNSVH